MSNPTNTPWRKQFAGHIAAIQQTTDHNLFHIDWHNPTNPTAPQLQFLFQGNMIAVSGSLSEAIYIFEQKTDMETLAQLSPDELAEFCKASPTGSKFNAWDTTLAEQKTVQILDAQPLELIDRLGRPLSWEKQDVEAFAHAAYHQHQLFGALAMAIGNSGNQTSPLLLAHWTALRMIHEQLSADARRCA